MSAADAEEDVSRGINSLGRRRILEPVIAGLDPAIHPRRKKRLPRRWMPGSSPGMTGLKSGSGSAAPADY
jgi:hypothetical protein